MAESLVQVVHVSAMHGCEDDLPMEERDSGEASACEVIYFSNAALVRSRGLWRNAENC